MILRKSVHIFLSLVLLVLTAGLTIDKHYCGSQLVSVSLLGDIDPCCDADDGCCHDDTDTYKLAADYTVPFFIVEFDQIPVDMPILAIQKQSFTNAGSSYTDNIGYSPPRKPQQTLSVLQRYRL